MKLVGIFIAAALDVRCHSNSKVGGASIKGARNGR